MFLAVNCLEQAASGAILQEDFSTDPAVQGWQIHGDAALFSWDSTNEVLRVTWDSSRTNSYVHLPLNTVLTPADDFEASFDLLLEDIVIGTTAGKPDTFPLAVSLLNLSNAKRTNLFIGVGVTGSGAGLRNAVEFNYFPDAGFGETFAAIAVSGTPTNWSQFLFDHDYPTPLDTGVWHRITLKCSPDTSQVMLSKTRGGVPYGDTQTLVLGSLFGDFRLDHFAISSYSDQVGLGSLRAHGRVDNLTITLPEPPVSNVVLTLTNGPQVHFQASTGWDYRLERSLGSAGWAAASAELPGAAGVMMLADTNAPVERALYRVHAERP
jgi:hypothetical protein